MTPGFHSDRVGQNQLTNAMKKKWLPHGRHLGLVFVFQCPIFTSNCDGLSYTTQQHLLLSMRVFGGSYSSCLSLDNLMSRANIHVHVQMPAFIQVINTCKMCMEIETSICFNQFGNVLRNFRQKCLKRQEIYCKSNLVHPHST